MNQSSDRGKEQKSMSHKYLLSDKPPQRRRRWIAIAILFLLSNLGVGAAIVGWYLIQKKLLPLVETETEKYLHRPVTLGELKSVSLTSARIGKSEIPPTQDNPDRAVVETVKVKFNLLPLLFKKTIPLDIILIQPDIYIEQDRQRVWTPTDFGTEESGGGGIKVDVETIQLQQAEVTLVARQSESKELNPPVMVTFKEGIVRFVENGKVIQFDATGKLDKGGKLALQGEAVGNIIDLDLDGKKLAAKEIENLLALPLGLEEGSIDSKIGVKLNSNPIPELDGTAQLNDVVLQIPGLVKPFSKSNGKLHFQGSEITLDRVSALFGEVKGLANGSVDIAGAGNYNISAKTEPIDANKVFSALELTPTPVPIQGDVKSDITLTGNLENPIINIAAVTTTPSRIDKLDFTEVKGNLELIGDTLFVRNFSGKPTLGGIIDGKGTIQLDEGQNLYFDVRGQELPGNKIASKYDTELPIEVGLVSGQGTLSLQATDPNNTFRIINGVANFPLGKGIVTIENLNYGNGIWRSQIQATDVEFDSLPFVKDTTPTIGKGLVNGRFEASGEINDPQLDTLVVTGNATLDTVGGKILAPDIKVAQGIWQGDFTTNNLRLRKLFPEITPEFNDNIGGEFYLTGKLAGDDTITGKGDLRLANGTANISELVIAGNDWKATALANNLELKQLSSLTPDQFAGLVNGKFNLAGTIDNITPEGIIATGDGSLTLREGVFTAKNLNIKNGNFTTQIIPEGVDLSLFADPNSDDFILEGKLRGELTATGKIDKLDPTAIDAKGYVNFSQGIDLLDQPFTANVLWNGSRLDVVQAKGDALNARGYIELAANFFDDIPDKLAAVNYFNFNVSQANAIDINRLKLTLPSWAVNLERSGIVDFTGKISGIPSAMDIDGNVILRNFILENLTFNNLQGKVRVAPNLGVNLALTDSTNEQQIVLNLDRNFLPQAFTFTHDNILVEGTGKQEIIQVKVSDFPLELLKTIAIKSPDLEIPPNYAVQPLSGKLSGDFTSNLYNLNTSGKNLVITSPILGKIKGNQIVGNFQYGEGYLAVQDVQFQQGTSSYQLKGNLVQKNGDIEIDGDLSVEQGQIQDVLVALEIFELTDFGKPLGDRNYAKSQDLYTQSSSTSNPLFSLNLQDTEIWRQLQKLAEMQAWLNKKEQERQKSLQLPELRDLNGTFGGTVALSGSLKQGLNADFQFQGKKWQWGKTKPEEPPEKNLIAEKILLKGDFRNNILTILPISINLPQPLPDNTAVISESQPTESQPSTETVLNPQVILAGTAGGETLLGKLILKAIPIAFIERFVPLPPEIAFGGIIDAEATISGTQNNPNVLGEVTISDATINETSVQSTQGSFNYSNARLNFFGSSVVAENADPIVLKASIPYELPFANTKPESDLLEISLDVKDRGLTLLNILSQGEVNWIDGQGEIVLDISGSFDQTRNQTRNLVTEGKATINQGKIAFKSLPNQYFTEVQSDINFNFDRISVESFTSNFSGGEISALGTIPLNRETPQDNPLTINLNNLIVNLKGLYLGEVAGQVTILGTALEPDITGDVTLSNGTILLSDTTAVNDVNTTEPTGLPAVTEYKDFQLRLGEKISINQPAIFNFLATGTLNIGGTFLSPVPEGTITLERGQVNLFTNQLNLAREHNNTARFTRKNELDPFLDVRLVGSAIETTQNLTLNDPLSTEIREIPAYQFGTLETVRISAEVRGLASQITNNIRLTSSPPRSQGQILALLGGNFVNTIGSSGSTLGLASVLFGSFNSQFNEALPFSEIRLFPTQITEDSRDRERIDALAGEVAFDLTDKFSFSVLKILNVNDIPAQFGVRYRLNDNFVLRGSSNFKDDNRTILEYDIRF